MSRHFLANLANVGSDASTPEHAIEAFQTLRPVGLEAIQLIFGQEMEKALRKAVESGQVTDVVRRSS